MLSHCRPPALYQKAALVKRQHCHDARLKVNEAQFVVGRLAVVVNGLHRPLPDEESQASQGKSVVSQIVFSNPEKPVKF